MRLRILVQARHLMPLAQHGPGDGGPNPPAANDENEHSSRILVLCPRRDHA